jgi:uncharacterized membrane protein
MRKGKRIAVCAAVVALLGLAGCSAGEEPSDSTRAAAVPPSRDETSEVPLEFFQKKAAAGIDFYATGNEPSWVLDIDLDKNLVLKTMSGLEFRVPLLEALVPGDDGRLNFEGRTEAGRIRVVSSKGDCMDTMSGERFTHKVSVEVRPAGDVDARKFEGCGRYLSGLR